ncbi:hypothetical protein ABT158_45145 [Nonomuraea sp. NPDC001636]|uniref:hypothetical protein n=1 Tax=Nonomuraea sp. NPDC001636 TaxID=3154391 RepID=UPI0033254418
MTGKKGATVDDGHGEGAAQPAAGPGGWKAARAWTAGVASATLIAAIGVVFTAWYTASGPDTIDRVRGGPPLTVGHVAVDYDERPLVLREPVTTPADRAILLGRAADPADVTAMLARHHVATIGDMTATVVLVGNRSSLRIIDIKPRVLTRAPPAQGAYLNPGSAGQTGTVELFADLDRRPVRFVTKKELRTPYFRTKQIDLKRDERVTLSLSIVGKTAYYEFDLVATVLTADKSEEIVIHGPGGVPFRLTGRASSYRTAYRATGYGGGWVPMPTDQTCTTSDKCCSPAPPPSSC